MTTTVIDPKRDEHTKMKRLLIIMRLLNSKKQGITLAELMDALEMTERTARRYIKTLQNIGLNVVKKKIKGFAYYRLEKSNEDYSEILDFLPELPSFRKSTLKQTGRLRDKPVWIYTDLRNNQSIVYDSVELLTNDNRICSASNLYDKLSKANVIEMSDYRIEKCNFIKIDKMCAK